jgi:hypothetical protein
MLIDVSFQDYNLGKQELLGIFKISPAELYGCPEEIQGLLYDAYVGEDGEESEAEIIMEVEKVRANHEMNFF